MPKLSNLMRQARSGAKWRGHELRRFKRSHWRPDSVAFAKCKNCDCSVTVNACPAPNEIDIGGDAVAIGCNR